MSTDTQRYLLFMMGITCNGKSTLMQRTKEAYGDRVHLVGVGKLLRAKYPPGYFQGLGAPQRTEAEALELLREGVAAGVANPAVRLLLVDGQPRRDSQIDACLNIAQEYGLGRSYRFMLIDTSDQVREQRILTRFSDPQEEGARQLSRDRQTNDRVQLYDVLVGLLGRGLQERIEVFPNSAPEDAEQFVRLAGAYAD